MSELNRQTVKPLSNELLQAICGRWIQSIETTSDTPVAHCEREALRDFARALRDTPELGCDYLRMIAGADYGDEFEMVYLFLALSLKHTVGIKVRVPRADPRIASLTDLFNTADWQEREIFDLYGVVFEGHPDLRRILLPDWWEGHPLRKDYESAAELRADADPSADVPGYVPPMEWLKNRKSAGPPGPAKTIAKAESGPAPTTEDPNDRVARARAKAAAIRAARETNKEAEA